LRVAVRRLETYSEKSTQTPKTEGSQKGIRERSNKAVLNEFYRVTTYFSVIAKAPSQSAGKEAVRKTLIREANKS
jgi:hypothetical protein